MMQMRRKEREVTDAAKIDAIMQDCDCCRLGFADGKAAYIVPVSFALVNENGKRVVYIHGAATGRKAELIRENGVCGFEMDTSHRVKEADTACGYSYYYQSVIGLGTISFVEDEAQKAEALAAIMDHYAAHQNWEFPGAMVKSMGILRMEITELSCKENM